MDHPPFVLKMNFTLQLLEPFKTIIKNEEREFTFYVQLTVEFNEVCSDCVGYSPEK